MQIDLKILDDQVTATGARRVTVELARAEGGGLDAEAALHHDLEGALRAFRFLAQKSAAVYDPNDARGKKALESIAKHLETVETLKTGLVDRLFPPRIDAR